MSILVAIGVLSVGRREILGVAADLKEDLESWKNFFVWLKSHGLSGVRLVIGDKALGMVETIGSVSEDKDAARKKARIVADKLRQMKLGKASQKVQESIEETLTYMEFSTEYWMRIRNNNTLERINREIKRRTRVVGSFPDGELVLR